MQKTYFCEIHQFKKTEVLPEFISWEMQAKTLIEAKKRLILEVNLLVAKNKNKFEMVAGLLNKEMVVCKN